MRQLPIEAIKPGMRVAAPFYNDNGAILLRTGTVLTEAYIGLLQRRGATALWIDDPDTSDITVSDMLSERTRLDASSKLAGLFRGGRQHLAAVGHGDPGLVRRYLRSAEFLRAMAALPYWDMADTVNSVVDEVLSADPVCSLLSAVKAADTYEFMHAVDTAVTAVILASRLGLDQGSLRRLARGCLIHDLGMALIDPRIVTKPGKLDDAERAQVEQHTTLGYEFLNWVHKDDVLANHIAYQHHERQDGQGYPRRLRGDNMTTREVMSRGPGRILFLAEIAAVADVYDALTADRPYRAALPPDAALTMMQRMAGRWLNAEVVKEFIRFVPPYPLATEVVVTDGPPRGCIAVVCKVDPKYLDRPIIRVLANAHGERLRPFELDLRRSPTIAIRALPPVRRQGAPDVDRPPTRAQETAPST